MPARSVSSRRVPIDPRSEPRLNFNKKVSCSVRAQLPYGFSMEQMGESRAKSTPFRQKPTSNPRTSWKPPAWGWKSRFKASRNQHLNRSLRPGNTWRSLSFLETRCVGKEMEEANRTNFLGGPPKENGRCPHVSFWPRAGSLLIRSLPPKKDPGQFLENLDGTKIPVGHADAFSGDTWAGES